MREVGIQAHPVVNDDRVSRIVEIGGKNYFPRVWRPDRRSGAHVKIRSTVGAARLTIQDASLSKTAVGRSWNRRHEGPRPLPLRSGACKDLVEPSGFFPNPVHHFRRRVDEFLVDGQAACRKDLALYLEYVSNRFGRTVRVRSRQVNIIGVRLSLQIDSYN